MLRSHFRDEWEQKVAFGRFCGIRFTRWDVDGATVELPYRDDLSAHPGVFHGGVLAAVIDSAGCGAIMAGHDYTRGTRMTTTSLAVQYVAAAPGEGVVAEGRCTRRTRSGSFAEVHVFSATTAKLLAHAILSAHLSGQPEDLDKILAVARRRHGGAS